MEEVIKKSTLALNPKFDVVYKGKMFEIITWEGKPGVIFEAAARSPGVRLLIECEKEGQKALLLTKEIRREAGGFDYRLPGGKVFDRLEEYNQFRLSNADMLPAAEAAAVKEGKEEVGVRGGDLSFLGVAKAGASVEWDLYYFLLKHGEFGEQEMEDSEQGDIAGLVRLTPRELFAKLSVGEIQEGRSAEMLWRWLAKNDFLTLKTDK